MEFLFIMKISIIVRFNQIIKAKHFLLMKLTEISMMKVAKISIQSRVDLAIKLEESSVKSSLKQKLNYLLTGAQILQKILRKLMHNTIVLKKIN